MTPVAPETSRGRDDCRGDHRSSHHSARAPTPPTTAVPPTHRPAVVAGPEGIGDPYYPSLGNSGYQVARYELDLTWEPSDGMLEGDCRHQGNRQTPS